MDRERNLRDDSCGILDRQRLQRTYVTTLSISVRIADVSTSTVCFIPIVVDVVVERKLRLSLANYILSDRSTASISE